MQDKVHTVGQGISFLRSGVRGDLTTMQSNIEEVRTDTNRCVIDVAYYEVTLKQYIVNCSDRLSSITQSVSQKKIKQTVQQECQPLHGQITDIRNQVGDLSTALTGQQ